MSAAAKHLIEKFESLPSADQREVVNELLRRAVEQPYLSPTDGELLQVADQVFLEYDRSENTK